MQLSKNTIIAIKQCFYIGLAAYIGFHVIKTAINTLPDNLLFFLTSDAVENLLCVLIAYLLFSYSNKLQNLWKQASMYTVAMCILIALAALKSYRIHNAIRFENLFNYLTSYLGLALLCYLLYYVINQLNTLNKYQELEKKLHLAQEQVLRNQLHPHFLFNAFNSLYSLSLQNHPNTSNYILKLSSMMRYITDDTLPKKVSLSQEIDFINKYIDIEKVRFGNNANIKLTVTGNTSQQFIEPFLLITLVENAFKHGFYTNSKNAYVFINLTIQHNTLYFNVENSLLKKQHFQDSNRKGKGLENLKIRLKLLYAKNASLKTTASENAFIAELKIISK